MALMLAKSFQDSASAGRKTAGRKTGFMGKGKSHHGRRAEESTTDHSSSNILNMDPDAPYRTHLLFPGRGGDESSPDGRGPSGSPSLLQGIFGGSWGKKSSTTGLPLGVRNEGAADVQRYRVTPEMDPFYRGGPGGKQVSFMGEERFSETDNRPERKPNSYNCDKPIHMQEKYFASGSTPHPSASDLAAQGREPEYVQGHGNNSSQPQMRSSAPQNASSRPPSGDPYMNGKGPPVDRQQQPAPPRRGAAGSSRPTPGPEGTFPVDGGPPPPRSRRPAQPPALREDQQSGMSQNAPPSTNVSKDCFVIPQENLERFLPDGITLPREPRRHPLINILEVDDPKLGIIFHLMAPFTSLTPHLDSPLSTPLVLQRKLAEQELARAKELNAAEGFLLKNLEKDSEYPFINYFVIHKNSQETRTLFRDLRTQTYDEFCPNKTGYACQHTIDLYDEVATIARPPVEPLSKRPMTDLTGYIVCLYRVFKGDDGEKFERNWLYWTGARMLYKNLPRAVGLRRITLHKSVSNDQEVVYLLLVECTHFMDHIGEAANLLPILRARICGYTGIFRVADSF